MFKLISKLFAKKKETESTKEVQSLPTDLIKGNINSKNEKIYHVAGGRFYDQVKPTEVFTSVEAAEAAGYRKSRQ